MTVEPVLRELTARFPGTCVICAVPITKGTRVLYDDHAKKVRCVSHTATEPGPVAEVAAWEPHAPADMAAGPFAPPVPPVSTDVAVVPLADLVPELAEVTKATSCTGCKIPLARGALAVRDWRTWLCVTCGGLSELVDRGIAGASARAEHLDRRDRREQHVRSNHKYLGGVILALNPDEAQGAKWGVGAVGEERLGPALTKVAEAVGGYALHDRAIPGSSANLDHIVVVPTGVFVVDSKRWSGRIEIRDVGGWFKTDLRVYVGGRDRSSVIGSGQKQAERINTALRAATVDDTIVCRAAMCFVDGEWPLLGASDHLIGGVHVCPPRTLYKHLQATGTLSDDDCRRIAQIFAAAFPAKKTTR